MDERRAFFGIVLLLLLPLLFSSLNSSYLLTIDNFTSLIYVVQPSGTSIPATATTTISQMTTTISTSTITVNSSNSINTGQIADNTTVLPVQTTIITQGPYLTIRMIQLEEAVFVIVAAVVISAMITIYHHRRLNRKMASLQASKQNPPKETPPLQDQSKVPPTETESQTAK